MGTYGYSGSPVFLTVATSGTYIFTGYGGQGGSSTNGSTTAGGFGGKEQATFTLTAGEHIEIIVGGAGVSQTGAGLGAGGGGGTFVLANTGANGAYQLLLAAGGGGGAYDGGAREAVPPSRAAPVG